MSGPAGPGSQAPDFALRDQHGQAVSLSGFRGRRHVLLVFYPFAFTGVCTGELGALRDRRAEFVNEDVQLLAVSSDSMFSLRVFADQEGFDFPLLSDFWPHGEVSRSYGVFDDEKGCARRGTFVIDKEGQIRWAAVGEFAEARDPNDYVTALKAL
ncbi:peroxiredoxin [Streptomyces hoynatensis]|uniref:Alkyl hydroperoxide reductase E n=1 Tax=Streptomyces hoynatensis TaxID=1141874 RepID=A0A3A9ZBJ4_9ACTN|nr:peroxiredoxin [Streptomyces hoynatensis]RKN45812.1 peroxiredoxin [Streptomyces hoynatensis]